jgi:hypothetical protein
MLLYSELQSISHPITGISPYSNKKIIVEGKKQKQTTSIVPSR